LPRNEMVCVVCVGVTSFLGRSRIVCSIITFTMIIVIIVLIVVIIVLIIDVMLC
jgi:hypothetical protein